MRELPDGWEWSTIGDVAEVNPVMSKSSLSDEDLVTFVPMASVAVESGMMDASDVQVAGPLKRKSFRQFADGDVLVAKITPSMENGKGAVARGLASGRGFGSTEFHVLRPAAVEAGFLLHFVLQPCFRGHAARNMTGTAGQLRVPPDYLRQHPIPVPPLPEQRRIVAAVAEHFSRLDAAASLFNSVSRRLERLQESAVEAALDGDWPVGPLSSRTIEQRYGTSAKASEHGDVPVLRMGNIRDGRLDYSKLKYLPHDHADVSELQLRDGDLLFNRTNSAELVGKSAVFHEMSGPVTFASYLIRTRLDETLDPGWASTHINSRRGRSYIDSVVTQQVGQANVNGTKLKNFPIPVPPIEVQRTRMERLEAERMAIDDLQAEINRSQRKLAALRRSILAAAFAGRLVPQNPADEPASLLLKRIAAERPVAKPSRGNKKAAS